MLNRRSFLTSGAALSLSRSGLAAGPSDKDSLEAYYQALLAQPSANVRTFEKSAVLDQQHQPVEQSLNV